MKQGKAEQVLKFAFGEAGTQVSPVTMLSPSPRASAPTCLLLFIKGPLQEGWELLLLLFGTLLWAF
jgi:hypothetical protein